ncbi:MAG: Clp protease N-terminal domain-containing protein, partial [Chloroflexota bacterium]
MSSTFERFTRRARQSLSVAQDEARLMNHGYIGTEHLLLGLMREEEGIAARVLSSMGLSLAQTRAAVERMVGRGERTPANLQLAEQTKRVIELAVDEAKRLGHSYIGTEHLLLGLLRISDSIAVAILQSLNLNREIIRRRVYNTIRQTAEPGPVPTQQSSSEPKGKEKSLLEQLGVDLTQLARNNELDPVIGRQTEIERVIQILARRTKNNPSLIGEPGVGKTAIVEGLAQRMVAGQVPSDLQNKRLVRLDVGSLVAGTMYRGQFEERMKRVVDEIKSTETVLFIDEMHMLVGAGAAGSSVDAANILKPALARGELQCIGATTLNEYRKHIESDPALERRFQPVYVGEPTVAETIAILHGIRERYEEHHNLQITDEALEAAARLAARYVPDRFLPDKAIDLVDEAASRVRVFKVLHGHEQPPVLAPTQVGQPVADTAGGSGALLTPGDDEFRSFADQLSLDAPAAAPGLERELKVTVEDIAEIVAMWTGVPVSSIAEEESARLLQIEEALHRRIIGQEEAIRVLARSVRRARAGLKDPRRPI